LRNAIVNAAGWAALPSRALEAARPAAPWLVGGGLGLVGLAAAYALWRANVQGRRDGAVTRFGMGKEADLEHPRPLFRGPANRSARLP
jgi:hypothetical protein